MDETFDRQTDPPAAAPQSAAAGIPLEDLVPILRGVSHVHSTYVAAVAGLVLIVIAPDATARWCSAGYALALVALFGVSGLLHRWRWDPRWQPTLRRLDHSTIFLFIGVCITVLAIQVLSGPTQVVVLVLGWIGAIAGITLSVAWIDAPRWLATSTYVLVSLAAAIGLPQMLARLSIAPLVLVAVGGALYAVGAVVFATRLPDPCPRVFGFHEVFHAIVIAAAAIHFVALAGWILI
ncbi:hemolysin III family protein [Patulibacter sp. NPDC049589]|uniref:PAQR family membrane homeostasis protein TrhA n=1 Tax=Patulibacter sp. NPDC049589 TaxID=3154731 RepID=UPI0034396E10